MNATVLPRGYMGIYWRESHQSKTMPFSVSSGEIVFSWRQGSNGGQSGELDALSLSAWCKGVSSNWISLKTCRPLPQTDSWHHHCRRMLPHKQQNWSHVLFPDPGLIIEYRMRPVLMVPVSGVSANTRRWQRWSGVSQGIALDVLSGIQLLLKALGRADKNRVSSSPGLLCVDPGCWENTFSPHDAKKGTVIFWWDHCQ